MELFVERKPSVNGDTVGDLYIDGVRFCFTLEDQIREQPGVPVAQWKVAGATAIPQGHYHVLWTYSNRFKHNTLQVMDVPGFSGIRIHSGNTGADTEGCLLVGYKLDGTDIKGGTSGPARDALNAKVVPVLESGGDVYITFANPQNQAS